jgi:hypothetical protein
LIALIARNPKWVVDIDHTYMNYQPTSPRWKYLVVSFVDGSCFARVFLSDFDRSRLRSFVRPLYAVRLTAGLDEVRVPGSFQTGEL